MLSRGGPLTLVTHAIPRVSSSAPNSRPPVSYSAVRSRVPVRIQPVMSRQAFSDIRKSIPSATQRMSGRNRNWCLRRSREREMSTPVAASSGWARVWASVLRAWAESAATSACDATKVGSEHPGSGWRRPSMASRVQKASAQSLSQPRAMAAIPRRRSASRGPARYPIGASTATAWWAVALIITVAMGTWRSCSLSIASSLLRTCRDAVASMMRSTSASQSALARVCETMSSCRGVTCTLGAIDSKRSARAADLVSSVSSAEKFCRTSKLGVTRARSLSVSRETPARARCSAMKPPIAPQPQSATRFPRNQSIGVPSSRRVMISGRFSITRHHRTRASRRQASKVSEDGVD